MVREFYANAKTVQGARSLGRYISYVRGHYVRFDGPTINSMLSIPISEEPCYWSRMVRGEYNLEEVKNVVCEGVAEWNYTRDGRPLSLSRRTLNVDAMEFNHVILSNIHPSTHSSEVFTERVFILYCMLTGRHMDLGHIISEVIAKAIEATRAIVCPSLIYKLCILAGVPRRIEDELVPGDVIGLRSLHRKRPRQPPREAEQNPLQQEEEEYRQRASGSGSGQANMDMIMETMREIQAQNVEWQTRVDRRLDRMEVRQTKMKKIQKFMKKQLSSLKKLIGLKKRGGEPEIPQPGPSSDQPEHAYEQAEPAEPADENMAYNRSEQEDEELDSDEADLEGYRIEGINVDAYMQEDDEDDEDEDDGSDDSGDEDRIIEEP